MNRFWLSYDFGIQGDYGPLYIWLDEIEGERLWRHPSQLSNQGPHAGASQQKDLKSHRNARAGCI